MRTRCQADGKPGTRAVEIATSSPLSPRREESHSVETPPVILGALPLHANPKIDNSQAETGGGWLATRGVPHNNPGFSTPATTGMEVLPRLFSPHIVYPKTRPVCLHGGVFFT